MQSRSVSADIRHVIFFCFIFKNVITLFSFALSLIFKNVITFAKMFGAEPTVKRMQIFALPTTFTLPGRAPEQVAQTLAP